MRLFVFKSESRRDLQAFAADRSGSTLPERHGPWTVTGIVGETSALPHKLSRPAIEKAIETCGFQMWRLTKKVEASA